MNTQQEAKSKLLKYIKPSSTLTMIIRSVAPSGMSRRIDVYTDKYMLISEDVAEMCELPYQYNKGILVMGCGMDMTFWLADNITHHLYGDKKPKGLKVNGGNCLKWQVL